MMGILGHRKLGDFEIWAVRAGTVKMDGGAMFGVIPRPLWEKRIPPDERNRIRLGMTCLLVRTQDETIVIETGFGGKVNEKLREIFGLDESDGLLASLASVGVAPEDVDRVIVTHLHQDHAGGCTIWEKGGYAPTFPNARYFVQRVEWDDAVGADAQTVNGFRMEEVLRPLEKAGVLNFLDGDTEICTGVRVVSTPGHTRGHQSVLVASGGETVCFVGDLVPTSHHLKPIYVMAYDLYPRETFVNKQAILNQAVQDQWLVVWPHDPEIGWSYVRIDDRDGFATMDRLD
ncbi:MAG: MBL fold metallo-hydrolase [bacterium]|nr:MBL fold metallo-hydrolase [bacterium]